MGVERTLAGLQEVVGEGEGDEPGHGENEEGEELALDAD